MLHPGRQQADGPFSSAGASPATTRPASLTGQDPAAGPPWRTDGEQPPTPPSAANAAVTATDRAPATNDGAGTVLFTPSQAAALLKVPESWLRRRAAQRQIPCTMLGKHLRFSTANLDQIITDAARPAHRDEPPTPARVDRSLDRPHAEPGPIRVSAHRSRRPRRPR